MPDLNLSEAAENEREMVKYVTFKTSKCRQLLEAKPPDLKELCTWK
jgi:hypothetical protein